jgi:hypothetical protein
MKLILTLCAAASLFAGTLPAFATDAADVAKADAKAAAAKNKADKQVAKGHTLRAGRAAKKAAKAEEKAEKCEKKAAETK